ncbi:MAG TPA: DUF3224 domain-containing protein [Acidimicrobiales bacterium]|jgi:hypothetical protein|nr:DUF3224 domain-containing protein [Acidimicrobiales bacterium]
MTTATGTFTVRAWDEAPYEERDGGAKLTRAAVTLAFSGDLEAEATVQWLMSYAPDGTAAFVGLQLVAGTLGGRAGSFVLQDVGTFAGGVARGAWSILAGSGAGDLAGISGSGSFEAGQDAIYSLDYEAG